MAVLTGGTIRQLGTPASVVRRPVDATVARLVGYDNVAPVQIDAAGQVRINGAPCGLSATATSDTGTLAAWGTAIRLDPEDGTPLRAIVERISPGPGRWEVTLDAGERLTAHLGLDEPVPRLGAEVGVRIDESHAVVIRGAKAVRRESI